jgi:hypothetical protein
MQTTIANVVLVVLVWIFIRSLQQPTFSIWQSNLPDPTPTPWSLSRNVLATAGTGGEAWHPSSKGERPAISLAFLRHPSRLSPSLLPDGRLADRIYVHEGVSPRPSSPSSLVVAGNVVSCAQFARPRPGRPSPPASCPEKVSQTRSYNCWRVRVRVGVLNPTPAEGRRLKGRHDRTTGEGSA